MQCVVKSAQARVPVPLGFSRASKEEIALGEREDGGGLACDEVTIEADFVGFGVYGDFGRGAIVHQIFFSDIAAICDGAAIFFSPSFCSANA